MKKYAYVTLLSSNNYIWGVIGLNYSLKKNNCKYPLIVITTDDISQENLDLLKKENIIIKLVKKQIFQKSDHHRYGTCINKLYLFGLNEYEKLFFLDADCIVIYNLDFLFNYELPIFSIIPDIKTSYNRGYIWGGAFLIKPSLKLEEYFFQIAPDFDTDEEILNDFFQNFNFKIFDANFFIIHDYNSTKKYWERYSLENKEKIKNFIDNSTYLIMKKTNWIYSDVLPH